MEELVRQMGPTRLDVETFITFDRVGTGNGGVGRGYGLPQVPDGAAHSGSLMGVGLRDP